MRTSHQLVFALFVFLAAIGGTVYVTAAPGGDPWNPSYFTSAVSIAPIPNQPGTEPGILLKDNGTGSGEGLWINWSSANRDSMARIGASGTTPSGGQLQFFTNSANSGTPTLGATLDNNNNFILTGDEIIQATGATNRSYYIGENDTDSGSVPVVSFLAQTTSAGSFAVRSPIFQWRNGGASEMTLSRTGDLSTNGAITIGGTGGNTPHNCATVNSTASSTVTNGVACPGSQVAVGGGCAALGGGSVLIASVPNPNSGTSTGWSCESNITATTLNAFAICCDQ